MIDTHLHLNDKRFNQDIDKVISEAIAAGVKLMVVSGYDYLSSKKALILSQTYSEVYATVGLHPSEVHKEDYDEEKYRELLNHPKVIGIGEIGLDYYWDKTYKDLQIEVFHKQMKLAQETNYAVVIHSRNAMQDTYEVLSSYKVKGIMHCYSGSLEMAELFIKLGYLIGIGGVLTFKNANLKDVVARIPLTSIVSETDAPYLSPDPYRGKRNEPKYIPIIVEKIAEIKNVAKEEVANVINDNFLKLFPLKE